MTAPPLPSTPEHAATDAIATVIIVNYNGAHMLPGCLDGLAAQTMPAGSFRTVVVDNASADPSRDLITEGYPEVELLTSYVNRGFAGGNNVALRRTRTKYSVLLNNDAIPEPTWLENLLKPLEADTTGELVATSSKIVFMPRFVQVEVKTEAFLPGGLDPRELGARIYQVWVDGKDVTNKVLFEKATFGPEGHQHEQYRWSFPEGVLMVPMPRHADDREEHEVLITTMTRPHIPVTFSTARSTVTVVSTSDAGKPIDSVLAVTADEPRFDVVNNVGGIVFVDGSGADRGFQEVDHGQYEVAEEVFAACGNGIAMRTESARRIGFFDERYFMYYEDIDLSWRLRAQGGRIEYVPDAVLRHLHSASSTPWSPRWLFHVERNRLYTLTKDATGPRAVRGVGRFVGTTAKMALRMAVSTVRTRRRPALGQLKVRVKIMGSYSHQLPGLLVTRRQLRRSAVVGREELENWLVTSR